MGQNLTHGVYLPDEGERNCYAGLAANWQILDTSVGTIAEHTTQIAGKAPLVHTHTKSDITDFPAYGNAAGTICEGNDARLSDARTPLSHTHTKSDVTDLLNSNFIPSANNSYDLGSSSYQWNNLYSKAYYYNGVAWGLDKANTWTGNNTFSNVITSKGLTVTNNGRIYTEVPSLTKGTLPSGTYYYSIQNDYATDSSSANNRINQKRCYVTTDGTNVLEWNLTAWNTTNIAVMRLSITANGTDKTYLVDANTIPGTDSIYDLGTSTNKWKSLNGVNPGALSIFNPSAAQDPIDIPNTWVTDGSAWNTLNVSNMGDGWICLTYRLCEANDYILARFGGTHANIYPSMIFPATMLHDSKYYLYVLIPVAKALGNIYLEIKLDSNAVLVKHSFIPAYGTV